MINKGTVCSTLFVRPDPSRTKKVLLTPANPTEGCINYAYHTSHVFLHRRDCHLQKKWSELKGLLCFIPVRSSFLASCGVFKLTVAAWSCFYHHLNTVYIAQTRKLHVCQWCINIPLRWQKAFQGTGASKDREKKDCEQVNNDSSLLCEAGNGSRLQKRL